MFGVPETPERYSECKGLYFAEPMTSGSSIMLSKKSDVASPEIFRGILARFR